VSTATPSDGRRYLISGLSRLTVRVAGLLVGGGTRLTVLTSESDEALASALPDGVEVIDGEGDPEVQLRAARLADHDCLLVLGEDDHENLRVVAAANEVAPDVPVVLRAFDARLAEQLERGLNVRRCYSASALAACLRDRGVGRRGHRDAATRRGRGPAVRADRDRRLAVRGGHVRRDEAGMAVRRDRPR
jgi:hypothetical protein